MKRIYDARVERGDNMEAWEYKVVASNGTEAGKKAFRQAIKDSGVKGGWRLVKLAELPGYVIV